ncbi:MAG: transcription elongation factor subunit Spt4 [Methanobacteriota archaeon]
MKACKSCKMLVNDDVCPKCHLATTLYWTGFFGVIDPEKSDIAKRIDIKIPGHYALKVR